jgi:hypothetical protein
MTAVRGRPNCCRVMLARRQAKKRANLALAVGARLDVRRTGKALFWPMRVCTRKRRLSDRRTTSK